MGRGQKTWDYLQDCNMLCEGLFLNSAMTPHTRRFDHGSDFSVAFGGVFYFN